MKFWDKLRIMKLFFQLVKDPNRTDLIFKQVKILTKDPNQPTIQNIEQLALSNETFHAMYDEHYLPEAPSLQTLAELPEGSFGRALYTHMHTHGLTFDIFPRIESDRAIDYLTNRLYQDHDLWHVLLGRGVEVEDELAIQAFGVAQYQSPIGTMIVSGGLLHLLGKNPLRAVDAVQKVAEGFMLGRKAQFLPSVRLHELFPRPLREVQEICGLA